MSSDPVGASGKAVDRVAPAVGICRESEAGMAKRRCTRRVLVNAVTTEDTEFQGETVVILSSQMVSGVA